jgi:hypothetical protein
MRKENDPPTERLEIFGMFGTLSGPRPDCERERTSEAKAAPYCSSD